MKGDIRTLLEMFTFSDEFTIYICTDKDIFTQILLNTFFEKKTGNIKLIAIEEGLGYYLYSEFKDKCLEYLYKLITPIVFGESLRYTRRLGVDPRINQVYLRAPGLLPVKKKGIKYTKFDFHYQITMKEPKKGQVLFFSFPEKDMGLDIDKKIDLIKKLVFYLKSKEKKLKIKPHPREDIDVLNEQLSHFENVEILENKITGEALNYFDYEMIFNFLSSMIIDILNRGYPKNKLKTIGIWKKPPLKFPQELDYFTIFDFKIEDIES